LVTQDYVSVLIWMVNKSIIMMMPAVKIY